MNQLNMFDLRELPAPPTRCDEIEANARRYVEANPEVWRWFVRFTFELLRAGCAHGGAKAVFERIRWYTSVETRGEEFRLNNNYTGTFARWFMAAYPEHDGFFRTRARTSIASAPRLRPDQC